MKKILFLLILSLMLFSSCSKEPIITNEELCGEWSSDNLTYAFATDGTHSRIRDGETFLTGTYTIKGERIIFTYSSGKISRDELEIISPNQIKIWSPAAMNIYLTTELEKTKACE